MESRGPGRSGSPSPPAGRPRGWRTAAGGEALQEDGVVARPSRARRRSGRWCTRRAMRGIEPRGRGRARRRATPPAGRWPGRAAGGGAGRSAGRPGSPLRSPAAVSSRASRALALGPGEVGAEAGEHEALGPAAGFEAQPARRWTGPARRSGARAAPRARRRRGPHRRPCRTRSGSSRTPLARGRRGGLRGRKPMPAGASRRCSRRVASRSARAAFRTAGSTPTCPARSPPRPAERAPRPAGAGRGSACRRLDGEAEPVVRAAAPVDGLPGPPRRAWSTGPGRARRAPGEGREPGPALRRGRAARAVGTGASSVRANAPRRRGSRPRSRASGRGPHRTAARGPPTAPSSPETGRCLN